MPPSNAPAPRRSLPPSRMGILYEVMPSTSLETPSLDRDALVGILVENHRAFLRFLEGRIGNPAAAEDLLQEAFVRSLEQLPDVSDEETALAWFYRVLRNAVIDRYRRQGAASRGLELFARELESAPQVPPPDVRDAACACIRRLAGTLKPEYAEALQRVELDGVPVREFAAEQGITPNTAAVRTYRARKALRREVFASCGTCAEHGCIDCSCRSGAD